MAASVAQCAVRMLDMHRRILVGLSRETPYVPCDAMLREYLTSVRTLLRWGAIEFDSASRKHSVTERGREILAAHLERFPGHGEYH